MTPLHVYRLQPQGGFHFGRHGIGIEQSAVCCPSDTLYSALFNEAHFAGRPFFAPTPNVEAALDPPLLLSSCFLYVGDVLLLPRPQLRLPLADVEGRRKLFKNLAYVSPTIFRLIVAQGDHTLDEYLSTDGRQGKGALYMGGQVWVAHADGSLPTHDRFWAVETTPHVTVDRVTQASNYYQVGQIHFAEQCGLYVLAQERHTGAAAGLFELLQRLGDSGLGGRRAHGLGAFRVVESGTLDLAAVAQPQRMVLLSRYRPSQQELDAGVLGASASYELVRVGGWLQTPDPQTAAQRRLALRFLSEGSVVQHRAEQPPLGTIDDVRPVYSTGQFPHPVWRYGLALGVGIAGA